MFLRLLLLFTLVPLAELVLLLYLGQWMGLLATLALVLATGALGAWLARSQGTQVVAAIRSETAAGRMPALALVDGALVLVAGAVLLTPGLLTDLFGFALLLPPFRRRIRDRLVARLRSAATTRAAGGENANVIIVDNDGGS